MRSIWSASDEPLRQRRRGAGLVMLLMCFVGLSGCGDDAESGIGEVSDRSIIEYHYGDASVPPAFHRSYVLTITSTTSHLVVDSYGDVLADESAALDPQTWDHLLTQLDDLAALDIADAEGCAGGTSRSLNITDGDRTLLRLDIDVCGDTNASSADTLDAAITPIIDQTEGWSDLVSGSS